MNGSAEEVREPSANPSRLSAGRRRRRLLRAAWRLALPGAAALAAWCLTLLAVIMRYEGQPAAGIRGTSDVAIVLGASLWNNVPSPGLRERLDHALALYRSGAVRHLLLTGGLDANGATLTEAEGMRNYLLERGVPAEAMELETESTSTYENLKFAKRIMERRGWTSAVIVTHQYHGSRAGDIAAYLGYDPVQVSVTESRVLNMPYHRTREVLAYTKWLAQKWLLHGG
ncbi:MULTISPECIES: YdcF family protein [Cohnella]|uniref:YdcF family protein n=1 Tax=Cohnella TaxID=329857 RepID=UPI0003709250|nr:MULTISPECIES: YdcF family protein [Cohnella]REK68682.1 MAG: YdcF family protein [Cohnella sp.]